MSFAWIPIGRVLTEVPVDPEAPEAREWLIQELSKPEYQEAKPTWIDLLVNAFWEWIQSLQFGEVQGPPALGLGIIVAVIVVGLIVAFLVFGMPRLNRRSKVTGTLFGEDDDRDAAAMRKAAQDAAARGDYSTAVAELFRSIARGLAERTIVITTPGTTAHDFSLRAATSFPGFEGRLAEAAAAFDDVRYLGGDGTAEQYEALASLERDLRTARPVMDAALV